MRRTSLSPSLIDSDPENILSCTHERIDQSSPELWPERLPGVTEYSASFKHTGMVSNVDNQSLTQQDIEMIQEFSSLTIHQIVQRFKEMKNQAYQLGAEESREMTRGKFLNVLGKGR